jgi:predicted ArsR family transcriptional regulator
MLEPIGPTQRVLLSALLHNKGGMTVDALAVEMDVSRNAVRQHLAALEKLGWVEKGARQPSGGRPEQLYVLTAAGFEIFPRQYAWLAELLVGAVAGSSGDPTETLEMLGASVGASVGAGIAAAAPEARVASVANKMVELGYEAKVAPDSDGLAIEAQNCVFHKLAMASPNICAFDLAMLRASTGADVDHTACMANGAAKCCFQFKPKR